ncbi:hypothetical protein EYF80_048086 [Liparis tanakae]|uniref:Uncharacterized protein n=1 Tax=Liparis tanakae TaxID=230148 RepID=A0A4Z2FL51_9TELE|nr:hypothetical protein EYF80_048086 [Liparis tanakae]
MSLQTSSTPPEWSWCQWGHRPRVAAQNPDDPGGQLLYPREDGAHRREAKSRRLRRTGAKLTRYFTQSSESLWLPSVEPWSRRGTTSVTNHTWDVFLRGFP